MRLRPQRPAHLFLCCDPWPDCGATEPAPVVGPLTRMCGARPMDIIGLAGTLQSRPISDPQGQQHDRHNPAYPRPGPPPLAMVGRSARSTRRRDMRFAGTKPRTAATTAFISLPARPRGLVFPSFAIRSAGAACLMSGRASTLARSPALTLPFHRPMPAGRPPWPRPRCRQSHHSARASARVRRSGSTAKSPVQCRSYGRRDRRSCLHAPRCSHPAGYSHRAERCDGAPSWVMTSAARTIGPAGLPER